MFSACSVTNSAGVVVPTLSCISPLIATAINWLLLFSGTVAVIFIIVSGIKLITSSGDAKRIEGARKTLIFAIAGLVLIFLSFAILRTVAQITGVACISPTNTFSFTTCGGIKNGGPTASCTSQGGVCYSSGTCPIVGTGIAVPVGGWSDCSGGGACCSTVSCTSQGGICYTSGSCPVIGTGIARPVGGWSDCSGACCSSSPPPPVYTCTQTSGQGCTPYSGMPCEAAGFYGGYGTGSCPNNGVCCKQ